MATRELTTEIVTQGLEEIIERCLFEPMDKQTAGMLVNNIENYLKSNRLSYPQFMISFEGSRMYIKPHNFIELVVEMTNNPLVIV